MNDASRPDRVRASGDHGLSWWRLDLPLAAGLALVGLVSLPSLDPLSTEDMPVDWGASALVIVSAGGLAVRRRHPVPAFVVVAAATAVYLGVAYPYGPTMFALALAVYSLARHRPVRTAAGWSSAALLAVLVHLFTNDAALDGVVGALPALAWVSIPFTIGVARRLVADARVRERAEGDRRLVDAERLRLAQEVHDVVGHGLAAIQMQADIALHVRRTSPGHADFALGAISKASFEALEELRATLAPIESGGAPTGASRAPASGLAHLDALCERVRAAGVDVDLDITGDRRTLPPAVDLAAYRILQESLTNVLKHSAHPRAQVRLGYDDSGIVLTVTSYDDEPARHREGFGIAGMRRRAGQLGGRLTAGPGLAPNTFRVQAAVPVPLATLDSADRTDQHRIGS